MLCWYVMTDAVEGEEIDVGIESLSTVDEVYVEVLVFMGRADAIDEGCSVGRYVQRRIELPTVRVRCSDGADPESAGRCRRH